MAPRAFAMRFVLITGGALPWSYPAAVQADAVAVVSARAEVASLTSEQVAALFLGKMSALPDGTPLEPVDQPEGSAVRDEFYSRIVGKTPAQVKAYWSRLVFTGKGQPPRVAAGDVAVRKLVAGHPGTIGYVDRSAVDSTLRIVDDPQRP